MRKSIYEAQFTERQNLILSGLRRIIGWRAGVTWQGNRLTVRWSLPGEEELVDVHLIIESIEDGIPEEERTHK